MKTLIPTLFLLLFAAVSSGAAQSGDVSRDGNVACEKPPLGLFSQAPKALLYPTKELYGPKPMKRSDLRDGRWTLSPLDEVDPLYKFLFSAGGTPEARGKCSDVVEISGKLLSPTGKLFALKDATYDRRSRKLLFVTIERDGIKYDAEIEFYPTAGFSIDGFSPEGTVTLKASGRSFGSARLVFPIISAGYE